MRLETYKSNNKFEAEISDKLSHRISPTFVSCYLK